MNESSSKFIWVSIGIIALVVILIVVGINRSKDTAIDPLPIAATPANSEQPATTNPVETTLPAQPSNKKIMHQATLTTNLGTIVLQLDPTNAPKTVANFEKLANEGYYNGVRFHRVISDFMIQTGDPLSKDTSKKDDWGTGGPGYTIPDELHGNETYPQGTLAMARTMAPNSGGSQFFIVTASPSYPLPPNYTVFGKVTKGIDVALKIQDVKTEAPDRPVDDVIIEKITIE